MRFERVGQLWFPVPWVAPRTIPAAASAEPRRRIHLPPARTIQRPTQVLMEVIELWDRQVAATPGTARKCSPFARAKTLNLRKQSRRRQQEARTDDMFHVALDALRPRHREDCLTGDNAARPCPWVGCRHHMALSVDEESGNIKETFPHLEILSNPEGAGLRVLEGLVGTCVLDICDKVDGGIGGIGGLLAMNVTSRSGKPIGQSYGLTIQETGEKLNLSVERARQIAARALQEVRVKVRRMLALK
jgi:hypothetical protein